ncbi:mitotic spindle assembly checkpoint protein MAD2B-like [Trifolium pratense]|uniref:Mitotic spindle assembly checkpoint protein MAD2B-like n=1 Tax=Trifolium pratense TaxID=57577 RepID=A0A2K3LSE0_TRIPR|nr:mitotic spindle assembly checkpoint protein MAD2B-like [Trifolium pratense]
MRCIPSYNSHFTIRSLPQLECLTSGHCFIIRSSLLGSRIGNAHWFVTEGMVERVAVIFFNAHNVPLEKFVFKLAMDLSYGSAVEEVDLQFSLRSFMSKLSISESLTKKLPPGKYKV